MMVTARENGSDDGAWLKASWQLVLCEQKSMGAQRACCMVDEEGKNDDGGDPVMKTVSGRGRRWCMVVMEMQGHGR